MNFFNNINLNQNELWKAVMHPLEQAPATAKQGQIYFNTVDKKLYYYNDTKWVAVNDIDLSNYATIAQLNDGLNKKLDKKTTDTSNTQVYAVTGDTQKMINATSAATENTVVLRDANGKLQVAAGAVAADAVNKGQMDDAIAAAVEAGVSGCERTSNKVGTITDPGNDTQYPNTKAVVNYVKSQVSKVKDVTLDGTSIVNTETGVVALESTYSLTLDGTSGTLKPTEYDNLSGDDASYIWYTQTGVQPIRLTKVMSGEGSLQYQAVVSDTVMAVIIQSDKTWEFAQFNVEKEPYHFTYQWGTVLTAEQKAGIQNDPNCYFYATLNGVTVRYRRVAVEGNRYYFTSMHAYTSDKVIDVGQVFVEITTGDDRIVSESIYAESLKNKTDELNASSTNTQYPTAKAVVYYVGDNAAPKNHATTDTTYGVGTTQKYGHVKLVTGDMNGKVNADGQVPSLNHTHSQYASLSGATFTGSIQMGTGVNPTIIGADGDVTIGGNLTVQGTTTTVESETLKVKDQLIEVASGNTAKLDSPAGLVVPKYDGTNNVALVFDNTGTAYVGDVVLDSNGLIDTTATGTKLVALAGRDKEANLTNNHVVKWDETNKILVDTGIDAANILINGDLPTDYVSTTKTELQTIKSSLQVGEEDTACTEIGEGSVTVRGKTASTFYGVGQIVNIKNASILTLPQETGTLALTKNLPTASDYLTSTPVEQVISNGVNKKLGGSSDFKIQLVDTSAFKITDSTNSDNLLFSVVRGLNNMASPNRVYINAPLAIGSNTTAVGTAGQVLTSQGDGKAPQWTTLAIPQGTVKKFVKDFTGKNADLEFSYEHKLGTNQCTVSLYKLNDSNNYEMVMADIILTTTNVIIKFAQAPTTTDSFRVVVTG